MMVDVNDDPMKNWMSEHDNDPISAVNARKKMGTTRGKMNEKLKRYITGFNSQYAEIKMAEPVTTIRQKVKGGVLAKGLELQTKCIWTGTPWYNKELPTPVDKSVFIQNRPELEVFVRLEKVMYHNITKKLEKLFRKTNAIFIPYQRSYRC